MADEEMPPPAPPETLPPDRVSTQPPPPPEPPRDFTPSDFAKALKGEFDSVRSEIGSMASSLERHANDELSKLETIGYNVASIQTEVNKLSKNVDMLMANYKDVNTRLTDHDGRLSKVEKEFTDLKKRMDQLQTEIRDLKSSA